jgi:hypothetical protein
MRVNTASQSMSGERERAGMRVVVDMLTVQQIGREIMHLR